MLGWLCIRHCGNHTPLIINLVEFSQQTYEIDPLLQIRKPSVSGLKQNYSRSPSKYILEPKDSQLCLFKIMLLCIFTQICVFPWRNRASLVAQLVKNSPVMWETWVWSLGWEDPLEKGMATHSSILAWRIEWTIHSVGLQGVGHYWETFTFTFHVFSILIFIIIFLGEAGRHCRKQFRLWISFLQLSNLMFSHMQNKNDNANTASTSGLNLVNNGYC